MIHIGAHVSVAKGWEAMGKTTLDLGGDTFAFFLRSPRGGAAKPVDTDDIGSYNKTASENGIREIIAHAPYTMNPCAATENLREFSLNTMTDDLARLSLTPGALYNFHPGSHVGQGVDVAIDLIAGLLDKLLEADAGNTTPVLLETMAGKGSEVGSKFEELRRIIDLVADSSRLGVCLDTCHISDGGYDVGDGLDQTLEEFDRVIGLERLHAIHLNDSKNPKGAHKDRHEKIGQGFIGLENIERIINNKYLAQLPFELETPNDVDGYAAEIKLLKGLRK